MTDENNQVVDAPVEPTTETAPEAQPETETAAPQEAAAETEDTKKGAGQRIRELNQQVKSLSDRVAELTQIPDTGKPYQPNVQPGEEITPQRYSEDVTRTADSIVNLRMKQLKAQTRIEAETSDVMRDYPQLNPKSKDFDPELSETITEAVEAHIRVDPYSASVTKFVGKLMKPYSRAVEKEVGQATEKIAKQVTQTALRPTQVKTTEKAAADMSIAELKAKLGTVVS